MTVIVIIIILLLLVMVFSYVSYLGSDKVSGWTQFMNTGQELGFSQKETETLKRLAQKCQIIDVNKIYTSKEHLEPCIRALVQEVKSAGEMKTPGAQDFLSKLYDLRKKVEMNKSQLKDGISSSRQIAPGQPLRVLVPGHGVFKSDVINTTTESITISLPANNFDKVVNWPECKVSVYFWRESDAGYVIDTNVIKEIVINGIQCLALEHSDTLFRTQKRKSVRIKLRKPAFLYHANPGEESTNFESDMGVVCYLEDISDTGCAFMVAGQAEPGVSVKVQFLLNNDPICLIGTVRSVEFMKNSNQSLVRVEANPATVEMRNIVLGEVFGTQGEEDSDLPFRVSEEEAEEAASAEVSPVPDDAAKAESQAAEEAADREMDAFALDDSQDAMR